jgi:ribosomal protein L44E
MTDNIFLISFDLDLDSFTTEEKRKNAMSWNNRQYKQENNNRSLKRQRLITCVVCGTTHTADYMRDHILMKKHINNEAKFIKKTQLK